MFFYRPEFPTRPGTGGPFWTPPLNAGSISVPTAAGQGRCGKCLVIAGPRDNLTPLSETETEQLSPEQIRTGHRLACEAKIHGPVTVTVLAEEEEAGLGARQQDPGPDAVSRGSHGGTFASAQVVLFRGRVAAAFLFHRIRIRPDPGKPGQKSRVSGSVGHKPARPAFCLS